MCTLNYYAIKKLDISFMLIDLIYVSINLCISKDHSSIHTIKLSIKITRNNVFLTFLFSAEP